MSKRSDHCPFAPGCCERKPKMWVIVEGEPRPAGIQEGDQVWIVQNAETKELTEKIGDTFLSRENRGNDDTKKANR